MYKTSTNGFSLVELSIVLVILGLLTGGILAGQNLIRAAELRSLTTQYNGYATAIKTFQDKYFAIPGDMRNATDFWEYPGGDPNTCPGGTGTGTQTCNGNGDGMITGGAASRYDERFMFWQHLANAGMIEGSFSGRSGTGGTHDSEVGINAPAGKVGQTLWYVGYGTDGANTTRYYDLNYGNYFLIGGDWGTNNRPHVAFLKPEELWNIDTKLDDGRPGYGKVIAGQYDECTDSDDETEVDGNYLLTETGIVCNMFFARAF